MNYRTLTTINNGVRDYQPGETLALADEDAALLLEQGYIVVAETTAGVPSAPAPSSLVNLNTASLSELMALPRIGERVARKLIAARPLDSLDQAHFVSGLTQERWADVAPLVEV